MDISKLKDIHKDETFLIVGNGPNLSLTPPEMFDFPSLGMNTIHLYEGWKPNYYTAGDRRVMNEFGNAIAKKFADIPKIVPKPKLNLWRGENFYRFPNAPGPLFTGRHGNKIWQDDIARTEMTYLCIMHIAIKLAYYMGAGTILIIGMYHKPNTAKSHFWGVDEGMKSNSDRLNEIFKGYKVLTAGIQKSGRKIFNISQDTYVPDDVIPQDDWRKYCVLSGENDND
jgi:hypothetical protein